MIKATVGHRQQQPASGFRGRQQTQGLGSNLIGSCSVMSVLRLLASAVSMP